MSAREVFTDHQTEQGQPVEGDLSLLRRAAKLARDEQADETTRALAREVVEEADSFDLLRAIVLTSQR